MKRQDISVFHDAFLQKGGAEQVVKIWQEELQTLVSVTGCTKEDLKENKYIKVLFPWIDTQRKLELAYPLMPVLRYLIKNDSEKIRLVSTSGIAHLFPGNWNKRILYFHSPARWIWDQESFEMGRNKLEIFIARILRPIFKKFDRRSIKQSDVILVNSENTCVKVMKNFGRKSTVLHPPVVEIAQTSQQIKLKEGFETYFLQVGRVRGYKGLDLTKSLFSHQDLKLILVGESTENLQTDSILGLGYVKPEQLRWLYENAQALIAVSREDFGLTPVEAAMYGCPTIAFKRGGYLESVREGISGVFVEPDNISELKKALMLHRKENYSSVDMKKFAKKFSLEMHMSELQKYL